jgi:hypothetical protein
MPPSKRQNLTGGESCVWCADSGWLYLRRYSDARAQCGAEYKEQIIAACGFCECGLRHYERYGGAWNYKISEIDASLSEDEQRQLSPDEKSRWLRVQETMEQMRRRGEQIQFARVDPDEKDTAEFLQREPIHGRLDQDQGHISTVNSGNGS